MNTRPQSAKSQPDARLREIIERVSGINLVESIRAMREARAFFDERLAEAEAEFRKTTEPPAERAAASIRAIKANKTRREAAGRKSVAEKLMEGSAAFWAVEAIRRAGRPLEGDALFQAIEEQGHKVKRTTLFGSLYRWVKSGKIFYLAKPYTFGLIEMKKG